MFSQKCWNSAWGIRHIIWMAGICENSWESTRDCETGVNSIDSIKPNNLRKRTKNLCQHALKKSHVILWLWELLANKSLHLKSTCFGPDLKKSNLLQRRIFCAKPIASQIPAIHSFYCPILHNWTSFRQLGLYMFPALKTFSIFSLYVLNRVAKRNICVKKMEG